MFTMRSKDPKTGTACNRETCLLKLARSGLCVTISGIIELGHNYSGWWHWYRSTD